MKDEDERRGCVAEARSIWRALTAHSICQSVLLFQTAQILIGLALHGTKLIAPYQSQTKLAQSQTPVSGINPADVMRCFHHMHGTGCKLLVHIITFEPAVSVCYPASVCISIYILTFALVADCCKA